MQLPPTRFSISTYWLWLALVGAAPSFAQHAPSFQPLNAHVAGAWTPVKWVPFSAQASPPTAYAAARLDLHVFLGQLAAVPGQTGEMAPKATAHLLLPDGSLALITVAPEIAIDPEIAASFPDLQTFSFESLPDREISGQLKMGPGGIYAFGRTRDRLLRIEPVQTGSGVYYLSYFSCDRTAPLGVASAAPTLLVSRR